MISQIFSNFNFNLIPEIILSYQEIFGLILGGFILHWLPDNFKEKYRGWFIKTPLVIKIIIIILVIFIIYQVKDASIQPFIYFKF